MRLKPEFAFAFPEGEQPITLPFPNIDNPLGPLCQLPATAADGSPKTATWTGTGFNVIWRPKMPTSGSDHFLELNLTEETLQFDVVPGPIPNRGLLQDDINMFGVRYLQQIMDGNTKIGLHVEPGIWAAVPQTTNPNEPPTVVRMASIPHGTVILAQGTGIGINGPPTIPAADITPFTVGNVANKVRLPQESTLANNSSFTTPAGERTGITQAMVDDPNSVLTAAIAGQQISETIILDIASDATPVAGGGTANTAFLQGAAGGQPNADAAVVKATFWIETVAGNPEFVQLQYTQTVLLNFAGLSWPHVTVATLRKQA